MQHLVVCSVLVCQLVECSVGPQHNRFLYFLSIPCCELNDVCNTHHVVSAVPVRPQGHCICRFAVIICRMDPLYLCKCIKKSVQVLNLRSSYCLVQIPAELRARVDDILGICCRRCIGHLAGYAVYLHCIISRNTFVVSLDLIHITHEIGPVLDLAGDILDQSILHAVCKGRTFKYYDVTEIT